MRILTEKGFQEFDGFIERSYRDDLIKLHLSNNQYLICTPCHEIMMNDGIYLIADFIEEDDILWGDIRVTYVEQNFSGETYDALNVKETSSFWTNGVISHNCIFLDEFAFVHKANEFYTSTYPVISSGSDTKVIITSTPNGIGNMFHKLWEKAVTNENLGVKDSFKPFTIKWWDVPGRDEEWKRQTIANSSELQFSQEFEVSFIGSSDTLIAPDTLLGLKAKDPIKLINDVRYYDATEEGHKYIMTVDVSKGRGQDYSTFNVIDVTQSPFKQVAIYRNNNISPLLFPDIIVRVAHQYNDALVIIENNDAGHVVCNAVYHEYEYENMFVESAVKAMGIGCTMTKRVKRVGCSNLKDIVESGKLTINDADTIQELASFEAKGTSYEASGSNNDDLVMNLVMFSWFASTDMFKESSSVDLKNLLFSERLREMEDDVVPFGIFPDNNDGPDMSIYQEMIDEQKEWNLL